MKRYLPKLNPVNKEKDELSTEATSETAEPSDSRQFSRMHSVKINQALKSDTKEVKEPVLLLHSLDFAGQPEYKPMHHCWITRRSMYLVVFNLQMMLDYIKGLISNNPVEELRYWIRSIHAHIYPPEEYEIKGDECLKRVCLVGTHMCPDKEHEITEDELDLINEKLREVLVDDDRCIDHIHWTKYGIFVPVENSIDDIKMSGVKALQDELIHISKNLKFLEEDYPLLWIRFEQELTIRQQSFPILEMNEVLKIAEDIGITRDSEFALQFFHDSGKIICLSELPV